MAIFVLPHSTSAAGAAMTLFQGTFRNVCVSLGTVAALCLFSPTSEVRAEN